MAWVDWAILVVLIAATLGGMAQGFFRSFFGLGGLFLGLVLAIWNYRYVGRLFIQIVHVEAIANAIGFLLIAILVMLIAGLLGGILEKTFRWVGLGCLDTLLGAVFGFLQGALMVMIFVLVTIAFFPGTGWLADARFPQVFFEACHVSMDMSPKELSDKVQDSLKKLKRESPAWMHPWHGPS